MTCDSRTHVNKKQRKLSLPSFSNVNLIVFDILIISSIKYYQIILYAQIEFYCFFVYIRA